MMKEFYDPEVERRGFDKGKEEGENELIKRMLSKGKSVEDIAELTDLPYEKIIGVKDKYKN